MINSYIGEKYMTYVTTQIGDEKRCSRCNTTKSVTDFPTYAPTTKGYTRFKNGIKPWCKKCYREYAKKYNGDARKNPDDNHYSPWRWSHYKRKYGLTKEEVIGMMEERNGKCDICGKKSNHSSGLLCVDHDHKTGKVRGLLCYDCNTFLGNAKDNINNLKNAINYLRRAN